MASDQSTPHGPSDNSPEQQIARGVGELGRRESAPIDDVTRQRHLRAMTAARSPRRRSFVAGAAAAAIIAVIASAVAVNNNGSLTPAADQAGTSANELQPLREVKDISSVPFERSEDYVILKVDASRAASVAQELAATTGDSPAVVGKTNAATTFAVPASAAQALSDASGIIATPDTPIKATTQQNPVPSWGLDRLDGSTLDNSYNYISVGAGEYVYVIDTGVYSGHNEFGGRVQSGYTAVADGNGTEDCNGHGTHVAGTIAGQNYGVAKSATVVAVRVLDCTGSGYSSSVIAGINWVIASHPGGAGIINLSLGGTANSAIDLAVADATAAGLVVVVAAGNSGADACSYSPARAPSALTIGAIDQSNAQAGYSNFGSCVDMWAPGSQITSAGISGAGSSATMSGTSMATPHVAGLAARLQQARPGMSASQITSLLTQSSLTANPAAIPVVEFSEAPDFATPATSTTVVDTTTTEPATTTTELVTTTTVAASPTTTVPGASTTTVVAPTTTAPRTTIPRRRDDENEGDKKGRKAAPMPREFSLKFGEDKNRNVLTASWVDDGTPDSYRIDCTRLPGGINAPIETSISIDKAAVTAVERYKRRTNLLVTPASGSRCWLVSILGTVTSPPSNPAIIPPARKRDDRPVTPTTTVVAPTTTVTPTTVAAPTTTVTPTTVAGQKATPVVTAPKVTTTVARPVTTQAPVMTAPKSTTTVPRQTTTTVAPKTTAPKKNDD